MIKSSFPHRQTVQHIRVRNESGLKMRTKEYAVEYNHAGTEVLRVNMSLYLLANERRKHHIRKEPCFNDCRKEMRLLLLAV